MELSRIRRSFASLRRQLGKATQVVRYAVAALSLSAVGFVAILDREGFTDRAVIPTKGDVPTVGFGSTTHEDGSPVRLGDKTNPVKAAKRTLGYLQAAETEMKRTLEGVELTLGEYELYLDWRYQFGAGNWRKSSMLRELRAGNYRAACDALLLYKFADGRDCSQPENWGPDGCKGVWTNQVKRHATCIAEGG
ncbi:MAG TPA: lysozyme [Ramlibacter sp.]|nr:lysozyme [Ramlibacter sp.]